MPDLYLVYITRSKSVANIIITAFSNRFIFTITALHEIISAVIFALLLSLSLFLLLLLVLI